MYISTYRDKIMVYLKYPHVFLCHSTNACSLKGTEDIKKGFTLMSASKRGWFEKVTNSEHCFW
jgi:hypothetical protein